MTDFFIKCQILGELYENYKEEFEDLIEINDIGFPIAYLNTQNLVIPTSPGMRYVEEAWDMLLLDLVVEDKGFEDLDDLLVFANYE